MLSACADEWAQAFSFYFQKVPINRAILEGISRLRMEMIESGYFKESAYA